VRVAGIRGLDSEPVMNAIVVRGSRTMAVEDDIASCIGKALHAVRRRHGAALTHRRVARHGIGRFRHVVERAFGVI
jgi:transposase